MEITPVESNGYFLENISSRTLVLDSYHTTYVSFNLTIMRSTLTQLYINFLVLQRKLTLSFPFENNLQVQLNHSYNQLENAFNTLHKVDFYTNDYRKRRGLINVLGSTIKFITGNLDQEDLENINLHFENLNKNQITTMHKINQLSSFAGHIAKNFQDNILLIFNNTKKLENIVENLSNLVDMSLQLQTHSLQITTIDLFLNKLLRTITFALKNTLDIELIDSNQIKTIWTFLKAHYTSHQLWPLTQLHELISVCKSGFIQTQEEAILVVKIPLFRKEQCNLQFVYLTPTNRQLVLIPPSKYYCSNLWYKDCSMINNRWFCHHQLFDSCRLPNCTFAKLNNNYKFAFYTHTKNLVYCTKQPLEVCEVCDSVSKATIEHCNIIKIRKFCTLIIGEERFNNIALNLSYELKFAESNDLSPNTTKHLNFKMYHLEEFGKMQNELFEPINYDNFVTKGNHYFLTGCIIVIVLIVFITILTIYVLRVRNSISRKLLQKLVTEDGENSKGGGVTDLEQP